MQAAGRTAEADAVRALQLSAANSGRRASAPPRPVPTMTEHLPPAESARPNRRLSEPAGPCKALRTQPQGKHLLRTKMVQASTEDCGPSLVSNVECQEATVHAGHTDKQRHDAAGNQLPAAQGLRVSEEAAQAPLRRRHPQDRKAAMHLAARRKHGVGHAAVGKKSIAHQGVLKGLRLVMTGQLGPDRTYTEGLAKSMGAELLSFDEVSSKPDESAAELLRPQKLKASKMDAL